MPNTGVKVGSKPHALARFTYITRADQLLIIEYVDDRYLQLQML